MALALPPLDPMHQALDMTYGLDLVTVMLTSSLWGVTCMQTLALALFASWNGKAYFILDFTIIHSIAFHLFTVSITYDMCLATSRTLGLSKFWQAFHYRLKSLLTLAMM